MNSSKNVPSAELVQALTVTAEITGSDISKAALRAIAEDVAQYPEHQAMAALRRCRRELTGRLTLAAILSRIDDGRPTPEIAWSQVSQLSERDTLVGTTEQVEAFAAVSAMVDNGDIIPARMAFLERYKALVGQSKDQGVPVRYVVSPGYDAALRESAVRQAHNSGLITDDCAMQYLPASDTAKLLAEVQRRSIEFKN